MQIQNGPFTDRVKLVSLRLNHARRPSVSGSILSRVDVSDTLVLELRADFYDAHRRHIAVGRVIFNEARPFHDRALRFRIVAAQPAPAAIAAALTIPQLVNESSRDRRGIEQSPKQLPSTGRRGQTRRVSASRSQRSSG